MMTEFPCKENRDGVCAPASRAEAAAPAPSLYVHVPFCARKCAYCDFASHVPVPGEAAAWRCALQQELELRRAELAVPLRTCYVGGGTPSVLPIAELRGLLEMLRPLVADDGEFSLEANPATIDEPTADTLAAGGVTRVTLGAQSFQPGELQVLGRLHAADDVSRAAVLLRRAGVANLAVDLIYAIPGQTPAAWQDSLAAAIDLQPQHVSCYALSFEENTPLGTDLRSGRVSELAEDLQRSMYDVAVEMLTAAGYEHYELSNFARPGRPCIHNLVYWRNAAYLGIGPAACSYVAGERRSTTPDFRDWLSALAGDPPTRPSAETETLDARTAMAETLMLALRLTAGVDEAAFKGRYGLSPAEAFPESVARQLQIGTLEQQGGRLRLAREAYFTSDAVLRDIIAETSPR
ncbi:MAG: radical SAM family heme chaperone HemW [Planctomycetes bacterium]|jgi:oxygen-independent coproporphyrinogen-3 oxidase|nr:radical SAM family heme chaperone HemW [Planctomycetota bacterium]